VSGTLFSELGAPEDIAVSGTDLYVTNGENGTIGEYTSSGVTVTTSLVSNLSDPQGIAIVPVPEPSTWVMLAAGAGMLLIIALRRRESRIHRHTR
jgi:DNA-binding beta-propeller fold protein YncE